MMVAGLITVITPVLAGTYHSADDLTVCHQDHHHRPRATETPTIYCNSNFYFTFFQCSRSTLKLILTREKLSKATQEL